MKQKFKFRHADEIAGTFVIVAAILFVVAVVLAGRSQGWFAGTFHLKVVFDTVDGSYGLREGAVVQVRNTVAGRVGKVQPTEDGVMGTTLIIKERFRPFITKDSVAKIKKTWGLAGDAYVEIERGKSNQIIEDGDEIKCVKDEEIMDTAQKMLQEFQASMQPMLDDIQKIVDNVADITGGINAGDGTVGAVLKDNDMRDDLTGIVAHLEAISADVDKSVGQLTLVVSNNMPKVEGVLDDVAVMTGQGRELLTNQVATIMDGVPALQDEVFSTVRETRRLIEGMQQMWLFRKYIKHDSDVVPLIPVVFCVAQDDRLLKKLQTGLHQARMADDSSAIARNAYNLAVARLAAGDTQAAEQLNNEARLACRTSGISPASTLLLQAEIERLNQAYSQAVALVQEALRLLTGKDKETRLEARIMLATIYLDRGDLASSGAELKRAEKAAKKINRPQYTAAIAGIHAGLAMRQGNQKAAAEWFAKQAASLREAQAYGSMVTALRQAADVYSNLGMSASAAEFYYRAAVSLKASGDKARAAKLLKLAEQAAADAGDRLLLERIRQLKEQK